MTAVQEGMSPLFLRPSIRAHHMYRGGLLQDSRQRRGRWCKAITVPPL